MLAGVAPQRWTSDERVQARVQRACERVRPSGGAVQLLHVDEAFSVMCVLVVLKTGRLRRSGDGRGRGIAVGW